MKDKQETLNVEYLKKGYQNINSKDFLRDSKNNENNENNSEHFLKFLNLSQGFREAYNSVICYKNKSKKLN